MSRAVTLYTSSFSLGVGLSFLVSQLVADLRQRGMLDSTLVVMTVEQSTIVVTTSESTAEFVTEENTELVGEFNPQNDRLVMRFPDIWSFDPHGGSGGKISLGGDARGLGGGTLVFEK